MSVNLTDGINVIKLNQNNSINLELKLNVSPYGHLWSKIGDQLYAFGIGNKINNILVNNEQFTYLKKLHLGEPE